MLWWSLFNPSFTLLLFLYHFVITCWLTISMATSISCSHTAEAWMYFSPAVSTQPGLWKFHTFYWARSLGDMATHQLSVSSASLLPQLKSFIEIWIVLSDTPCRVCSLYHETSCLWTSAGKHHEGKGCHLMASFSQGQAKLTFPDWECFLNYTEKWIIFYIYRTSVNVKIKNSRYQTYFLKSLVKSVFTFSKSFFLFSSKIKTSLMELFLPIFQSDILISDHNSVCNWSCNLKISIAVWNWIWKISQF